MTERAILTVKETCHYVSLSREAIRRLEIEGKFPRRRKVTGRKVGFLREDLDAWARGLPAAGAGD